MEMHLFSLKYAEILSSPIVEKLTFEIAEFCVKQIAKRENNQVSARAPFRPKGTLDISGTHSSIHGWNVVAAQQNPVDILYKRPW